MEDEERPPPRRVRRGSLAGNPVLVGAVTALITIVSVFLAYNATEGLPFAPTYDLRVELPDALNLIHGNEVKLGGNRVGIVKEVVPGKDGNGAPIAIAQISLDPALQELPNDSTWVVRPRSPFGLKYLELTLGSSGEGIQAGGTVPRAQIRPDAVDWAHFQEMFEEPTRRSIQLSLQGFGDAFAGRGADINTLIPDLSPLLEHLRPVAENLAARGTGLDNFFRALGRFSSELAPVSAEQGRLFVALDTTFTAVAGVARPHLQRLWSSQPPLYEAGIEQFPGQQRFLRNVSGFWHELQPGAAALIDAAPDLADVTTDGLRVLRQVPELNGNIQDVLVALRDFAEDPVVPAGVRRLTETVHTLRDPLDFLVPLQTRCNYMSVFFRNFASLLSEGYENGTWGRSVAVVTPTGPGSEGSPAPVPADGEDIENHLHHNPYPNTAGKGQRQECEGGNEDYIVGKTTLGNLPGNQGVVVDKDTETPIQFFGGGFEPER